MAGTIRKNKVTNRALSGHALPVPSLSLPGRYALPIPSIPCSGPPRRYALTATFTAAKHPLPTPRSTGPCWLGFGRGPGAARRATGRA